MPIYEHYTIYRITNIINNKVYFGQTINLPEDRWKNHLSDSQRHDYPLYLAMRKHGIENFIFEPICSCFDLGELNARETLFILEHNSHKPKFGYNCDTGGNNKFHNEETKIKIANSTTGPKNHRYGKNNSPIHKAKISENHADMTGENNPMFGHVYTDATISKMKKPKSETHKANLRKPKSAIHIRNNSLSRDSKIYHMVNTRDGREYIGYRWDFITYFDLKRGMVESLVNKRISQHKGWIIKEFIQ